MSALPPKADIAQDAKSPQCPSHPIAATQTRACCRDHVLTVVASLSLRQPKEGLRTARGVQMYRLVLLALALTVGKTGAWADAYKDCQAEDPDRSIHGCTQVIKRGKYESRKTLARACGFQGIAYAEKGEFDCAIADFCRALEINPSDQSTKYILNELGVTP